jgi:hypothetical protein
VFSLATPADVAEVWIRGQQVNPAGHAPRLAR